MGLGTHCRLYYFCSWGNNLLSHGSCDQVAVEWFNPQRRRVNFEPSLLCRGFSPRLQLFSSESHKSVCILAWSHISAEAIQLCRKGMQDLWGQRGRLSKWKSEFAVQRWGRFPENCIFATLRPQSQNNKYVNSDNYKQFLQYNRACGLIFLVCLGYFGRFFPPSIQFTSSRDGAYCSEQTFAFPAGEHGPKGRETSERCSSATRVITLQHLGLLSQGPWNGAPFKTLSVPASSCCQLRDLAWAGCNSQPWWSVAALPAEAACPAAAWAVCVLSLLPGQLCCIPRRPEWPQPCPEWTLGQMRRKARSQDTVTEK